MEYLRPMDYLLLFLAFFVELFFARQDLLGVIPAAIFLLALYLYRKGAAGELEKIFKPGSIFAKGLVKPSEVLQYSVLFLVLALIFSYFFLNPIIIAVAALLFFFATKLRTTEAYLATVLDFLAVLVFLLIPAFHKGSWLYVFPIALPIALVILINEILEDLKHPYTVANANIPRLLGIKKTKQLLLPFIAIFALWTYAPLLVATRFFFFGPIALGFALAASYAVGYEKYEDGIQLLWFAGFSFLLSFL